MEYLAHIADDGREQTVGEHLRSAAEYASRALAPAGLCEASYLCALLHDCGKYTELFDRYIHSNGEMRRGSVNHTFSGVRLIMDRCHNEPPANTRDIFGELLAYAVGAHHGEFDIADEDGKNGFFHRMKKEDIGYEEAVSNYTELCADTEELDRRFKSACDEVTPIFDRITDIAADNSEVSFYVGMLSRLLLSAVIEGDRRDTAEFMSGVKRKDDEIPDWNELLDSVETAQQYSTRIIVEDMVENLKEINCSVLGDCDDCQPSILEEPIKTGAFLSYDDKYKGGTKGAKGMQASDKRIPADLPKDITERIQFLAKETFRVLSCHGVSRVDFMVDASTNNVFVNEINTIPGSLSFYLWEATGIKFDELMDRLVQLALKRKREQGQKTTNFDQNIFSLGGGVKGAKGAKC